MPRPKTLPAKRTQRAPAPATPSDGRRENSASTQAALLAAGRKLFGGLGYDATSVGMLCAAAGVTSGALYHHYVGKQGLFAAVAEDLDAGLVVRIGQVRDRALAQGADPWQAFLQAVDAFLATGTDAAARRIGLTDAPAVLGTEGWAAIRERHGLGAMIRTVEGLQAARLLLPGDPRNHARLILGLLYGAVEALPRQPAGVAKALVELRRGVHAMLNGLRRRPRRS